MGRSLKDLKFGTVVGGTHGFTKARLMLIGLDPRYETYAMMTLAVPSPPHTEQVGDIFWYNGNGWIVYSEETT